VRIKKHLPFSGYTIALPQAVDLSQFGGKAANLARAVKSGVPVPEGFVIRSAALHLFLETNQFFHTLQAVLSEYNNLTWQKQIEQFDMLRNIAIQLPIPKAIQEEVEPLVLELLKHSPTGVAVRSSGAYEDLENASFAGIYESYLGVEDLETFWQSVLRCWCSTWSPQAAAYAQKMDITLPLEGMAVLVQTMIPAESAGVIFTADPVTGNPWRFVLNATFGLAQKLVDGSAPADRFVLAWDTAEILEKRIAKKTSRLVFQNRNVGEEPLPDSLQRTACLSNEQVREIGRMALTVDRVFERRMDIEWGIAGGRLYLLQARPLTALPPFFPHELSPEEAAQTWTPYLNRHGTMNKQERLIAPYYRERWLLQLWNYYLSPDDVFPHRIGKERDFNDYRYSTEWQWGGYPGPVDWRRIERWLDEHEPRLRRQWLTQLEQVHQINQWLDTEVAKLQSSPNSLAVDWIRTALRYEREEYQMQAVVWYASQWMIFNCEGLLKWFFNEVMPSAVIPTLPDGLLQGLSCYSVDITRAAQALGRTVDDVEVRQAFAKQPLSQVIPDLQQHHPDCTFLQTLSDFCRTYGLERSAFQNRQNPEDQDIEGVLLTIKMSMFSQGMDATIQLAESAARRQGVEAQVRDWLYENQPEQLERFNKLLDWAQFWTPALDNRKWHYSMAVRWKEINQLTKEALLAEGLIDALDHFLLFSLEDWASYVENPNAQSLRTLYEKRKHAYEHNRRLDPLPFLGAPPILKETLSSEGHDGEVEKVQISQESKMIYQGEGIAPGKAQGIAYKIDLSCETVLDDIGRLSSEHILICARDGFNAHWRRDWHALFMMVRGLVTVQGTQLHHATQIARECGVPFINLPEDALESLPDNQLIEIDGQAGTLSIVSS
jgi:phosphohistidine swiveling domain-containing protein